MRLPRKLGAALRPFAGRVRVPILAGENRGLWWNLASAGHGYATGRRGAEQMGVLASLVRPGDCVWDVGAHHGYMTLCAARRTRPHGRVYAFEPSALNHRWLEQHLRWNHAEGVTTLRLALSDFEGETRFGGDGTSKTYAIGGGDEAVPVDRGDALVRRGVCMPPTVMKIDVEGAEGAVLRGMGSSLPADARLLVAVHSPDAFTEVCAVLASSGFRAVPSAALREALDGRWQGDPELLALGPRCDRVEREPGLRDYFAA